MVFPVRTNLVFSYTTRPHLISATFLPLLDDGDLLFMNAPTQHVKKLDGVYLCYRALCFITGCGNHVHHSIALFILLVCIHLCMTSGSHTSLFFCLQMYYWAPPTLPLCILV